MRIWVADATAHGMRPWFTKFAGSVYDRRWLGVVEDIYTWQQAIEPYLRNKRPLADVALVYSQRTAHFYGGEQAPEQDRSADPWRLPGARRGQNPLRNGPR